MKKQLPFRPQVFLFRMLASIFIVKAALLIFSFAVCTDLALDLDPDRREEFDARCPRLGDRAADMFELAIATTLSLLAGGTFVATNRRLSLDVDRDEVLPWLPARVQDQAQESAQAQVQESAQAQAQELAQELEVESAQALPQEAQGQAQVNRPFLRKEFEERDQFPHPSTKADEK